MDIEKITFIQQKIPSNQILLVVNKSDLFYLTGINLDGYYLGITKQKVLFFTPKLLYHQLKENFNSNIIVFDNLTESISKLKNINSILLEKNVDYSFYEKFVKKFKIKFCDIIKNLRQIKTKSDIEEIKIAAKICNQILSETKKKLVNGVTELEMKKFIKQKFIEYGVEPAFDPIVAFDENTSYPHHISENKKFNNSLVLIDLGCRYKKYCCDITRMYNFRKDGKILKYYRLITKLQKMLINKCKAGTKVSEIDLFAYNFCKKYNIEQYYLHATGHGIGIDVHEPPRIYRKNEDILKENMVITIEPGIYFFNKQPKFGIRIEDTIWITKDVPIILT